MGYKTNDFQNLLKRSMLRELDRLDNPWFWVQIMRTAVPVQTHHQSCQINEAQKNEHDYSLKLSIPNCHTFFFIPSVQSI